MPPPASVRIAVTGSIATDHLMTFPGRFADQLVAERLDRVSLSFLVDDLEVRRGGIAANICYGLGQLGVRPLLLGAVGHDFEDYRSWLNRSGVDTSAVHVSTTAHTARFLCTTDADMCQIASFYPGAMSEARDIELGPIAARTGGFDLVVISPDDPEAMLRHTQECRDRGFPFAADPSQQLARMEGAQIRQLIDGATFLFSNDYERGLIADKTGWSGKEILQRVRTRVTTLGADGVRIDELGTDPVYVPAVPEVERVEPTGVGDGFRAGFLAAWSWGLPTVACAQVGNLVAVEVLEVVGTQEYTVDPQRLLSRCAEAYGLSAAETLRPHLVGNPVPVVS